MSKKEKNDKLTELLEILIITELINKGVPQANIRKLLGLNINKINDVAKLLKISKK